MTTPGELYGRPWSEREYIIVLYYYLKNRNEGRHEGVAYVQDLAQLLGRSLGSVLMRLENYAGFDPAVARKGLSNLGPVGQRIFEKWFRAEEQLFACAEVLIRESRERSQPTLFDPEPVRIPKAFGRYELLDLIGEGACGSVYSCTHATEGGMFALKIIWTDKITDNEILGRFRREIRLLKSQFDPGVIRIFEDNLDSLQRFPGFIMEYARKSLRAYVTEKTRGANFAGSRPLLPSDEAAAIIRTICASVSRLHEGENGMLHRDINPNNILLLPDGRWILSDFSLGKFTEPAPLASSYATETYQGWGTEPYAAPEQWRDFKRVDHRADVYALGVLIWELLCPSWPPFDRNEMDLPPLLKAIVLRATSRNKEDRFTSVTELLQEFEAAILKPAVQPKQLVETKTPSPNLN